MAEYITKDAVISLFEKWSDGYAYIEIPVQDAIRQVSAIPPADVRPVRRGRWELAKDGWYCTACELYPPLDCDPEEKGIPYCPNCGSYNGGDISADE